MNFRIKSLDRARFQSYFAMSAGELERHGANLVEVDSCPGYPCRVSLEDAAVGEWVLAIPYCHHDVAGPYRSVGPIFIRIDASRYEPEPNEVPEMLRHRLLSVRAYSHSEAMVMAENVLGAQLESVLRKQFVCDDVAYIHIHNSQPGCFACLVERVSENCS